MVIKIFKNFFKRIFSNIFKSKSHIKLGFYGPPNAGKTSLANRICKDFTGEEIGKISKIPHETRSVQFKEKVDIEDLEKSKKIILFFGNFVSLEMEKFIEGIKKLKNDQSLLYDNMSIDLFYLGKVLAKKYKLLNYSYLIFMIGLIISVVSFVLIFFFTFG